MHFSVYKILIDMIMVQFFFQICLETIPLLYTSVIHVITAIHFIFVLPSQRGL
jgi:hypothetical protein